MNPRAVHDALVAAGVCLWLLSAGSFLFLRWRLRTHHRDAWQRYGTPLFVPILDRRRWSRESSRFWWSEHRELGDTRLNRAMTLCRIGFAGVVLTAIALLALQFAY